jgi:hypothetical protein
MAHERDPEQLRAIQQRRAEQEAELAEHASDDEERLAHERRAEKAEYLRDKLAEQERAPDH